MEKETLLMIDVGNTTMNIGVYADGRSQNARFPTKRHDTPDAHAVTLLNAFALTGTDAKSIGGAVIASVVPSATGAVSAAIARVCGAVRQVVVGPGVKTGLNIKIDDPAQLGADLVATAVGAAARYKLPVMVYDLGTATKISVISKEGRFLGGVIYPGVGVSLNALGESASLLPNLAVGAPPKSVIGPNSEDAMQSGILYGTAGALDGMADRIDRETGETHTRVATGGYAAAIVPHLQTPAILRDELIFDGMRVIYEKNM